MSVDVRSCRGSGRSGLIVRPRGPELLRTRGMEWLFSGDEPLLIVPHLARCRITRRPYLLYEVGGLVSLRERTRSIEADRVAVEAMLCDLLGVLEARASHVRHDVPIIFDPRFVFADESHGLRFVCAPLSGVTPADATSPLALLRFIGKWPTVRDDRANDVALLERLGAFAEGEGNPFSINRLRDFMAREGMDAGALPASQRMGRGQLHALRDVETGLVYELREGGVLAIGRGAGNQIMLANVACASRRHASVRCGKEGVFLSDAGSTNGTYVHGLRLVPGEEVHLPWESTFSLAGKTFRVERGVGNGN